MEGGSAKSPPSAPSGLWGHPKQGPGETLGERATAGPQATRHQTSKWRAASRVRLEQGKHENSANPNEVWTSADCNIATLIRRSWQMHHGNVAGEQQGDGAKYTGRRLPKLSADPNDPKTQSPFQKTKTRHHSPNPTSLSPPLGMSLTTHASQPPVLADLPRSCCFPSECHFPALPSGPLRTGLEAPLAPGTGPSGPPAALPPGASR